MPTGVYHHKKGNKSNHWKGGIIKKKGYVWIYNENHPFRNKQNYVQKSRLVMEKWLRENEPDNDFLIEIDGRKYLRKEFIIHHKNKKVDDNRIENMKVTTKKGHQNIHHKGIPSPKKGRRPAWNLGKSPSMKTRIKLSLVNSGKSSTLKGKKLEEIVSKERAKELKNRYSINMKEKWKNKEYRQRQTDLIVKNSKHMRNEAGRFIGKN